MACGWPSTKKKKKKCTTYAGNTVRMSFSLEPNMRCHEASRTRNYNTESDHKTGHHSVSGKGKDDNSARPTHTSATALNRRLSAPRARHALHRSWTDSSLCDSQKHTTCLDVHFSACLKHSNFLHRQNTVCPTAVHTEHHGNNKGTGIQTIGTTSSDSNTVRSPNVSDLKSREFQLLYSPYPRTPPRRTESWIIGDGDSTFEVLLGVCSRDLGMSRASSESRISPLTASAVTRATTSLHKGPPFTFVRLVREVMSVRVHAARFLPPARPILQYLREIDSVWPSTDAVHTDLILDKQ